MPILTTADFATVDETGPNAGDVAPQTLSPNGGVLTSKKVSRGKKGRKGKK